MVSVVLERVRPHRMQGDGPSRINDWIEQGQAELTAAFDRLPN